MLEMGKAWGELCNALRRAFEQGVFGNASNTQAHQKMASPTLLHPPQSLVFSTPHGDITYRSPAISVKCFKLSTAFQVGLQKAPFLSYQNLT